LDDDDEVLENKNSCTMYRGEPTYLVMSGRESRIDADTILETERFGKILNKFETNNKLGIASGGLYHEINGKLKLSTKVENFPSGTGRV